MHIGRLDLDEQVMVVAEIGNNHEGSVTLAVDLIGRAAEAGVDAVKFQTYRTEDYVSPRDRARFEQLKSFELTIDEFRRLADTAGRLGVLFLSTPFDPASARALEPIVCAYKVASGDNTHWPLLETVAATDKPLIISTGLADLDQIRETKRRLERFRAARGRPPAMAFLHCVSGYPVPSRQANLAAIPTLAATLGCQVGYSDHTLGIDAAALSVAAGARIVEKHFTLDHEQSDFRDHRLSADPQQMAALVGRIRAIEAMLGTGRPDPQPCERELARELRRSIAARRDLPGGTVIRADDLTWVRPGGGLPPGREDEVIGRELSAAVAAGQAIGPDALREEAARR